MSTIIKRLRMRAENHGVFHTDRKIMAEAADEIERLNGLLADEREGELVAYLHTMHMEGGQTNTRLSFDPSLEAVFGKRGENYSSTYRVTVEPLARSRAQGGMDKGVG